MHDVRLGLEPGQIVVQASVNYQGFDLPAVIAAVPSAAAGKLDVQISSVKVSGLPAPAKIKAKVAQTLSAQWNNMAGDHGHIDKVEVTQGQMTVSRITG